ncbi:autophagocytosis associated protein [Kalaharituber pfeilii]|nr:autophagocytosis associated protein [Kalaharituber pfeilii]
MIGSLRSTWSKAMESIARPLTVSKFRTTGEITMDEFVQAGDYLVYKFPTWSWSGGDAKHRNPGLPADKQFLVTKEVPCLRRLDDNFAAGWEGGDEGEDEEWAGVGLSSTGKVTSVDEEGVVEDVGVESEDEIPDMEDDDDDEAIIRDSNKRGDKGSSGSGTTAPRRQYSLYICYSVRWRTPCLYLSGYHGSTGLPLTTDEMMEDIMGDYKDKTVTIEDFPHLEGNVKMASIHPCKHAEVMRGLLDRADASLKMRRKRQLALAAKEKEKERQSGDNDVPDVSGLSLEGDSSAGGSAVSSTGGGMVKVPGQVDEWEEIVAEDGDSDEEPAIRVDQYLVVFLKFMASVTPGIEHDFTMGL